MDTQVKSSLLVLLRRFFFFFWNKTTPIYLQTVYSCFCATSAECSNRDENGRNAKLKLFIICIFKEKHLLNFNLYSKIGECFLIGAHWLRKPFSVFESLSGKIWHCDATKQFHIVGNQYYDVSSFVYKELYGENVNVQTQLMWEVKHLKFQRHLPFWIVIQRKPKQ